MLQTATQLNFPIPPPGTPSQSLFQIPVTCHNDFAEEKFDTSGDGVYRGVYAVEKFDSSGGGASPSGYEEEFDGAGSTGKGGVYPGVYGDEELESSGHSGREGYRRVYSDEEFEGSGRSSTTGGSSEAEEGSIPEDDWTEYFSDEKNIESFNNTVGGHSSIYTFENGCKILKPANPSEKKVYEKLQKVSSISEYIPKYYGTLRYDEEEKNFKVRRFQKVGEFIVLENLTKPFNHPCVMDLKMGSRTYRDEMTNPDIAKRKVKSSSTTAMTSGFKISGLRVYQPTSERYLIRKYIRRNRLITDEDISFKKTLSLFLFDGVKYRLELVKQFLVKLQGLHDALDKCRQFDFMASSVLLIYEGDSSKQKVDVRLIDFDHTIIHPDSTRDQAGIRFGLRSLMSSLRKIMYWCSKRKNTVYNFKSIDKSDNVDNPIRRYSTSQLQPKIPHYLHKTKYLSLAHADENIRFRHTYNHN
jgi:1D-myo-inositol-tetrakisphosphate 5-kinase/inositol-polyphosphate multikinase